MTNAEYRTAYKAAQLASSRTLAKTRKELLKTFKQAGDIAAQELQNASAAGLAYQLQVGADMISKATEELTPIAISTAYGKFADVDNTYILDAVKDTGNTVITSEGLDQLVTAVNLELVRASAQRVYADGYTFSERVWKGLSLDGKPIGVNGDYQYRIKQIILTGQAQGRDNIAIASDIQTYIAKGKTATFKAGRYGKLIPGTKQYLARIPEKVDWRALRLVRSELYASLQSSQIAQGAINPACLDQYKWIKNSGNPIDINGSKNASGMRCIDIANGGPYTYAEISAFGYQHANCYAEGTEVYTNEGWKDFRDVDLSEKFLSVNPETKEYEWVNAVAKQDFVYKGEAIRFKHKWLELITTPGHNNFVVTAKGFWSFKTSQELYDLPAQKRYPRYFDKWTGNSPKTIKLGNYDIDASDYCEFMGYYLSEGCVSRHTHGNAMFGSIAQLKGYNLKTIGDLLEKMPFYCGKSTNGWYFYDQSVCKYLYTFGKSWVKHVPSVIKELSKDLIKVFLDAYILGDGSVRGERVSCSGIKSNKSTCITTSSKQMADELGELIIKVGGYPSFYWQKAKWIKHKNGTYLTKHPAIVISWNRSKYANLGVSLKVEKIPYDGRMLDVTLEKNHILWVRYNGKTCFSGNCMCRIEPILQAHADFLSRLKGWQPGNGTDAQLDAWYRTVYSA